MRRRLLFPCLLLLAAFILLSTLTAMFSSSSGGTSPTAGRNDADRSFLLSGLWGALSDRKMSQLYVPEVDDVVREERVREQALSGGVIMGKLGNETLRAELGRSAWHVLHTIAARFPKSPTPDESEALRQFVHYLARLYPCGECAREFTAILAKHPPKTGGRAEASEWVCEVHNIVNRRLGKPEFDCQQVADRWKCGCADEELEANSSTGQEMASNGVSLKRDWKCSYTGTAEWRTARHSTYGHVEWRRTTQTVRHFVKSGASIKLDDV